MSYQVQWFCDACGAKIPLEEVQLSHEAFATWGKEKGLGQRARELLPEVFCDKHIGRSAEYWSARLDLVNALNKESSSRLEKQKNRFWSQFKVVGGAS